MNIVIIGYGSIGQRHEKNCLSLGHNVDVLSRHDKRLLNRDKYDLVIICSKTSEHLADVKKHRNLSENFLIEKPLAVSSRDAQTIKKSLYGKKVRVGYCLLFSPIIRKAKQIIEKGSIGKIFFVEIYAGSFLPEWRKGEDYSKRYSANKEEGGGVALDLIHEINYAQFLFGDKITNVYSHQTKVSNLKITSSDLAHFALCQKDRCITITLNYFQRPAERYIKLVGAKKTLVIDLANKAIGGKQLNFDSNQMYIDEIKSMEKFIKGEEPQNRMLTIDQAIFDLKVIEGKL